VRAFDISISVKSNKADLQIMKEQVAQDYLHAKKWGEIGEMNSKLKEAVEASDASLKDQFEAFRKEQIAAVYATCERLIKNKFIKYDNVSNSFQKFLYEGEMSLQLDRKADINNVLDL